MSYQRYGGWYDGNGDEVIIDNTQTGLQYSDRIDVMGTGTLNIDDHQQLQLTTQYYKSESDGKHGLYLGKNFSAVTGMRPPTTKVTSILTACRVPSAI